MAKLDKLFVTEAECAERIGVPTDELKAIAAVLTKQGFPPQDPLFKNRRYWPAVRAWLDWRYGMSDEPGGIYPPDEMEPWKRRRGITGPPGIDGKENWK
ncbi:MULTISPECIES: winged helix-turn-helix domain-containing protein [Neorhizobium]|uniref:winged helix-turn-helix domain-containing protein n=1 Tax=Neorhizobium TaxID=1525371 RepID=UPI000CF89654|nr:MULTISPECIES: winged helix-turn-helix domain-containing protein [Neorhizobium]